MAGLAAYVGSYGSHELGVDWKVEARDGQLFVQRRKFRDAPLKLDGRNPKNGLRFVLLCIALGLHAGTTLRASPYVPLLSDYGSASEKLRCSAHHAGEA